MRANQVATRLFAAQLEILLFRDHRILHGFGQCQEPVEHDILQGIVQVSAGDPRVVLFIAIVRQRGGGHSGPLLLGIQGQPDIAAVAYGQRLLLRLLQSGEIAVASCGGQFAFRKRGLRAARRIRGFLPFRNHVYGLQVAVSRKRFVQHLLRREFLRAGGDSQHTQTNKIARHCSCSCVIAVCTRSARLRSDNRWSASSAAGLASREYRRCLRPIRRRGPPVWPPADRRCPGGNPRKRYVRIDEVHVRPGVRRREVAASSGSLAAAGSPGYVSSVSRMFLTRISVLPSWPPSIIHPTASFGAVCLICLIFPIPNDSGGPGGGHLWLFPVGKNLEVPHFKRVLRHLSVRPLTPSPVRFPAAAYPVCIGSAAIRRTMLPNNRRVRWLSASINQ